MAKKKRKVNLNTKDEMSSIIHRILESQDFESIEDMQRFLNENVTGKNLAEIEEQFVKEKTAQQKAQDLVYEAYNTSRLKARTLIRQALELDPNCAEAYHFKGQTSGNPRVAKKCYFQAMEAAEKTLGKAFLKENKGHFWGMHETRPYMKAKFDAALCMNALGEFDEAIQHMQELLELNPNDNQGVRYYLFSLLLQENILDRASKLYEQFLDDFSANWYYNRAILAFKKEGPSKLAKNMIEAAFKFNPHVPTYLFNEKPTPLRYPDHYGIGDENEAFYYLETANSLLMQKEIVGWIRDSYKDWKKKSK